MARLPYSSFRDEDRGKRILVDSPVPGCEFQLTVDCMLNGSWTVAIEAERTLLLGLAYRSMYKVVEITPDGPVTYDSIQTRLESFKQREIRRNWGREEA